MSYLAKEIIEPFWLSIWRGAADVALADKVMEYYGAGCYGGIIQLLL